MMQEKGCSGFERHIVCEGCSFYFPASLINNLRVKTVFASYYLKLSLPMSFECFLIFA